MVNKKSRVVCLPMSWDANEINKVIDKYAEEKYSPISIGGDSVKLCILFEK